MKKSTFFCDIDGTLMKYRQFETYKTSQPEPINENITLINDAYDKGNCVVLTTARPEYLRHHTIEELNKIEVKYTTLIMGIARGTRILINDRERPTENRAVSVNINRDMPFNSEQEFIIKSCS